ncbi:unnamed protein product, partial [Didymodactylos carnosus]
QSQTLSPVNCTTVLAPYFSWLTTTHAGYSRSLSVQASMLLKDKWVSYYSGTLAYSKPTTTIFLLRLNTVDSLVGTSQVWFSDRFYNPPCNTQLCLDEQLFSYKSPDTQTIQIYRDGTIGFTLNSWGNTKSTDQLQCFTDGIFYCAPTQSQVSMFMMSIQMNEYEIPR